VPIHDVGVDPSGRLYFVMKNIEGETLESVIEHLRAGEADYHREYTFERRIEVFINLLRALEFAHSRGYVHRDIKPANVMIGRFGEVVLMDWGIAKSNAPIPEAPSCTKPSPAPKKPAKVSAHDKTTRPPVLETQVGALLGTPAYMSPEQARGDNAAIDSRSDLYSAGVLFHEFLTLNYYFSEHETVPALLAPIDDLRFRWNHHPTQPHPPIELLYFLERVLRKEPEERIQSAHAMIHQLQGILEGKVIVQCHVTFAKRLFRELGRLVDRYTHVVVLGLLLWLAASIGAIVILVRWLLFRV
jgi:serine/threonine-protein kinase